jgi:hypothetical protein
MLTWSARYKTDVGGDHKHAGEDKPNVAASDCLDCKVDEGNDEDAGNDVVGNGSEHGVDRSCLFRSRRFLRALRAGMLRIRAQRTTRGSSAP